MPFSFAFILWSKPEESCLVNDQEAFVCQTQACMKLLLFSFCCTCSPNWPSNPSAFAMHQEITRGSNLRSLSSGLRVHQPLVKGFRHNQAPHVAHAQMMFEARLPNVQPALCNHLVPSVSSSSQTNLFVLFQRDVQILLVRQPYLNRLHGH